MMSLTLRSGRDGRFLARVVERHGFAFVLDFGDKRIIEDLSQRINKGFTMWRLGKVVNASPNSPQLLTLLADFYAKEGLLVFLEEPTWTGRTESLESRLPQWSGAVVHMSGDADEEDSLALAAPPPEDSTELISADDLAALELERLGYALPDFETDDTPTMELDQEDDAPTELIDREAVKRLLESDD